MSAVYSNIGENGGGEASGSSRARQRPKDVEVGMQHYLAKTKSVPTKMLCERSKLSVHGGERGYTPREVSPSLFFSLLLYFVLCFVLCFSLLFFLPLLHHGNGHGSTLGGMQLTVLLAVRCHRRCRSAGNFKSM